MQNLVFHPYDIFDARHEDAFVSLLMRGSVTEGLAISRDTAMAVTNMIGWTLGFDVFLAGTDRAKGMLLTTEADFVGGKFLCIEKIITQQNLDKKTSNFLFQNALTVSWETGKCGLIWKTGDASERVEASNHSHSIVKFEEVRLRDIRASAQVFGAARLAAIKDLDDIDETLRNYPVVSVKYGHLTNILARQEKQDLDARTFIVTAEDGSLACATGGSLVFNAQRRLDLRVYLSADANPEHVSGLIKEAATQFAARKWRGPSSVELVSRGQGKETDGLVTMAENELRRIGGERLWYGNAPMVSHYLDGMRYIDAVVEAVGSLRSMGVERPLSEGRQKALDEAVLKGRLDLS